MLENFSKMEIIASVAAIIAFFSCVAAWLNLKKKSAKTQSQKQKVEKGGVAIQSGRDTNIGK